MLGIQREEELLAVTENGMKGSCSRAAVDDVRIYFTYPSPFSYLAWHRITVHPERYPGIRFRWTPVLFRRLMALQGGPAVGSPPLLLAYSYGDAKRWAEAYGIPLATPHRAIPVDQTAHKIHLLAQDAGGDWEAVWMERMQAAVRRDGMDPTNADAVRALAAALLVPGLDRLGDAMLDVLLEDNTQQALADGAVGVPFFTYRGNAYWGNDRLAWLEAALAGHRHPDVL